MKSAENTHELNPLQRAAYAVKEMRVKLDAVERAQTEPIAVIGMSCRFPGASNCGEFWRLLREGREAITEVPKERWDVDAYYDPNPNTPGKINTRYGGFLPHIDRFDPYFFGIAPQEATFLDPQHRLLLETTWEALENAGQNPKGLAESRTGVFIGMNTNDYGMNNFSSLEAISAYSATGNGFCFACGRLSYFFGLHGPTVPVDTACSSSLVALHLASQSLRLKECDMAIVGGIQLHLSPALTIALAKTHSFSSDGRCKSFDAAADGFGMSEGCGVIILKRYSDALVNRDYIQSLIRGSAVNHDGPSSGITVPNEMAQEQLIRQALHNARVSPSDVSYVETHGTGTSLGDPIEVEALSAVLGQERRQDDPLLIGTVKTNVAHMIAAAGIGGLIKVVLSFQNQEIPPNLHFKNPNPHIDWETCPVRVPTKPTPWVRGKRRRIAGVSSFGISGTNAHVVLEEAPVKESRQKAEGRRQYSVDSRQYSVDSPQPPAPRTQSPGPRTQEVVEGRPLHLLTLSAQTESALRELVEAYQEYLNSDLEAPLSDVCFTANAGRAHFRYRLAVIAESSSQLKERLNAFAAGEESSDLWFGEVPERRKPLKVAFLFTDGISQQPPDTGSKFYETLPIFRETIENLQAEWESLNLGRHNTQGSLFSSFALTTLWQSWGISPAAVLGQGNGEYVAAWAAGIFSLKETLALIANGDRNLSTISFQKPRIPIISGVTGEVLLPESIQDSSYWQHLCQQENQLFSGLNTLIKKDVDCILEITSESVLDEYNQTSLFKPFDVPQNGSPAPIMLSSRSPEQNGWRVLMDNIATLYVHGAEIDWAKFDKDDSHQRIPLPTYPFQRKRYWLNTEKPSEKKIAPSTKIEEIASPKEAPRQPAIFGESPKNPLPPSGLAQIMSQQLDTVSQTINQIIAQQLDVLRSKNVFRHQPEKYVQTTTHIEEAIAASGKCLLPEHFVSSREWQLLVISAQTETALEIETQKLLVHLKENPECNLTELAYASQQVQALPCRRMAVCRDVNDAIKAFEALDRKRVKTKFSESIDRSVVFMFPGVGDHYVNMAKGLYRTEPIFQKHVNWLCEQLQPLLERDLREILYPEQSVKDNRPDAAGPHFDLRKMLNRDRGKPDKATEVLNQTQFIHPAMFIIEYALAQLWMQWGIQPQAMIGYSLGEYVTACLAGVISPGNALTLLTERAKLIQELSPGAMLTVMLSKEELTPILNEKLSVAVISTPSQCVVAGSPDAVNDLENRLKEQNVLCRSVPNFHPVHSPMMEPIRKPLTRLVETFSLHPPKIPYISNVTGTWVTPEQATDPRYWAQHTCQTAYFADGIGLLLRTPGRILLEVGPGQNLGTFVLQHPLFQKEKNIVVVSSLRSAYDQQPDELFWLNMLGKIWLAQ